MADTTTPNLGLVKPEINGPQTENVWGFDLNNNFDKIDARFGKSVIQDAPQDGYVYGRFQGAWARTPSKVEYDALAASFYGHTHTADAITDLREATEDIVATVLKSGPNIVLNYNDAANTLTISAIDGATSGTGPPPPVGDYGDISVSNQGLTWTIDPNAVTFAKIQAVAADRLLGTGSTAGNVQEILCTAAGRSWLTIQNSHDQRISLGLGTASLYPSETFQAADTTLSALAALSATPGLLEQTGQDLFSKRPVSTGASNSLLTFADADVRYVNTAGDNMTGNLATTGTFVAPAMQTDTLLVNSSGAALNSLAILNKSGAGSNYIFGRANQVNRWIFTLGDAAAETGGNAGSSCALYYYGDNGVYNGSAFTFYRNGTGAFGAALTFEGPATFTQMAYFNVGAQFAGAISFSGAVNFNNPVTFNSTVTMAGALNVGGLATVAGLTSNGTAGFLGYTYFQSAVVIRAPNASSPSAELTYAQEDGGGVWLAQWNRALDSYNLYCVNTGKNYEFSQTGRLAVPGGHKTKAGETGAHGPYCFNLNFIGGNAMTELWIDSSNFGPIVVSSDYRIKKDVAVLGSMWDTVKALNPISYTRAAFTPPIEAAKARETREFVGDFIPADDVERWGFIAHELQDTLLPSAASGVKDQPDAVQSINLAPVVAALTKALQEAMARIEALEAAP